MCSCSKSAAGKIEKLRKVLDSIVIHMKQV